MAFRRSISIITQLARSKSVVRDRIETATDRVLVELDRLERLVEKWQAQSCSLVLSDRAG